MSCRPRGRTRSVGTTIRKGNGGSPSCSHHRHAHGQPMIPSVLAALDTSRIAGQRWTGSWRGISPGAAFHLARNASPSWRGPRMGHPPGACQRRPVADPGADPHRRRIGFHQCADAFDQGRRRRPRSNSLSAQDRQDPPLLRRLVEIAERLSVAFRLDAVGALKPGRVDLEFDYADYAGRKHNRIDPFSQPQQREEVASRRIASLALRSFPSGSRFRAPKREVVRPRRRRERRRVATIAYR